MYGIGQAKIFAPVIIFSVKSKVIVHMHMQGRYLKISNVEFTLGKLFEFVLVGFFGFFWLVCLFAFGVVLGFLLFFFVLF